MIDCSEFWLALRSWGANSPVRLFALAVGSAVLLHTAVGLGRARRWYMLPLLFGLVALAGFLLNPFADANTLQDLRVKLTAPETLTSLCIVQFLLILAALVIGLRTTAEGSDSNAGLLLAVVHVLPTPALLIAMLVLEQAILGSTPGARPEAVGRQVGFAVAGLGTLAGLLAMVLPQRWLAGMHGLLGLGLLLACMFLPNLDAPLPESLARLDLASLDLCWKVALAFAVPAWLGWAGGYWTRRAHTNMRKDRVQWES